jgi:hypothetical protein
VAWNPEIAKLAREHNDANILVVPARFVSEQLGMDILKTWLDTPFEGGRHSRRVEMDRELEERAALALPRCERYQLFRRDGRIELHPDATVDLAARYDALSKPAPVRHAVRQQFGFEAARDGLARAGGRSRRDSVLTHASSVNRCSHRDLCWNRGGLSGCFARSESMKRVYRQGASSKKVLEVSGLSIRRGDPRFPLAQAVIVAIERYGASSAHGSSARANYLLKWEAIRSSREQGATSYDLWGLATGGIAHFKTGFGGREVRYIGVADPAERDRLLGGALGLLHLIHFDEPFGLELMAERLKALRPLEGQDQDHEQEVRYIFSGTLIPSRSRPLARTRAVNSHSASRELRAGSSDFRTGHAS